LLVLLKRLINAIDVLGVIKHFRCAIK
jgi:hypothetical protein